MHQIFDTWKDDSIYGISCPMSHKRLYAHIHDIKHNVTSVMRYQHKYQYQYQNDTDVSMIYLKYFL